MPVSPEDRQRQQEARQRKRQRDAFVRAIVAELHKNLDAHLAEPGMIDSLLLVIEHEGELAVRIDLKLPEGALEKMQLAPPADAVVERPKIEVVR